MADSSDNPTPSRLSKTFDLLTKAALLVTCIVGVYACVATERRDADQSLDKKRELQQKETDLFYKQTDMQRATEAAKADFLQKNLALLVSSEPGAMRKAEALIDTSFAATNDALDVKNKARHIHASAAEPPPASASGPQFDYKARGFQYVEARYYAEAALSFSNAIALAPDDAQAWNALAYVQLKQGNTDGAYTSISRAIELKPADQRLASLVVLNATKILCAQGEQERARVYLNVAVGMNAQFLPAAKGDGELIRLCEFTFT